MESELERYKKALKVARLAMSYLATPQPGEYPCRTFEERQKEIDAILNPPPEMTPVSLGLLAAVNMEGKIVDVFHSREEAEGCGFEVVMLTGVCKRPKPQPVERSVTFPCRVEKGGPMPMTLNLIVSGENCMKDAAKRNLLAGKHVTLTATWTEDPPK